MFLPDFVSDRKHRVFLAALLALILVASGCASSSMVRAQQDEIDAMKKHFADLSTQVGAMSTRLDSIEGKVTASTPSQPSGPKPVGVTPHPSEGIGSEPEHAAAATDPEPGFINDDAIRAFRKAMILFEAGRYGDSSVTFTSFLEKYPDHPFAGAAQFYVGESYFRQKQYAQAYDEFQRVLTTYDRSSHVADTLRDLAETEEHLHKGDDAARHRQQLSSLFPSSPAYASVAQSPPRHVLKEVPVKAPLEEISIAGSAVKSKKADAPGPAPTGPRATQLDPPPSASSFAPPMPDVPAASPPTAPVENLQPKTKPTPQPGDLYPATEDKS